MTTFRDVSVVSGCGVGGGSLGYANTLYVPPKAFFEDRQWGEMQDWEGALAPHYAEAQRMLGVVQTAARRPRRPAAARARRGAGRRRHLQKDARRRLLRRARRDGARPVLRRRGAGPHGLSPVRALHGRLPARLQEHARQELPVSRREARRAGDARTHRRGHPPARRRRRRRRLRGRKRALGRLAAQGSPRAARARRGRRGRAAGHEQAAAALPRRRLAAAHLRRAWASSCAPTPSRSSP